MAAAIAQEAKEALAEALSITALAAGAQPATSRSVSAGTTTWRTGLPGKIAASITAAAAAATINAVHIDPLLAKQRGISRRTIVSITQGLAKKVGSSFTSWLVGDGSPHAAEHLGLPGGVQRPAD